jgi:hypothetical protein
VGGNGDTDRLEHLSTGALALSSNGQNFLIVLNDNLLEGLEILFDIGPFKTVVGLFESPIQFFSQDKSQETAKHMASDGFISFMKDGSGIQDGLHVPEDMFHLPEFFVLQGYLF